MRGWRKILISNNVGRVAKFSENGKPVHEECYVAKIKGELRKSPSTH
jgi:hypothetical protein